MTLSNQTRGTLIMVIGVTALSIQGLLIRQVSADRWTLICWRGFFLFLSLSIGLIVCWRRRAFSRFRAIGWKGVIAAVILAVANILFVTAFTLTSIANTLVLVNSTPLLVALLSWLVLREKVPSRTWIAIPVGLGGIAVILHRSLTGGAWAGDLCALGAAAIFAVYLIILRHARQINMLPSLTLSGVFTFLLVLPWAAPFSVSTSDLGWIFIFGGITLPVGMGLITVAPRYIPATEVGLIMLLEAVLGTTWAWLIISENPGMESLLGGALVIGALAFNSLAGWKSSFEKSGKLRTVAFLALFLLPAIAPALAGLPAPADTVGGRPDTPVVPFITPDDLIGVICSKYRMSYQEYLKLKQSYLNQLVEWRIEVREPIEPKLLIGRVKDSGHCWFDVYCSGKFSGLESTILPGTPVTVSGRLVNFSYNMVTGQGRVELDAVKLNR